MQNRQQQQQKKQHVEQQTQQEGQKKADHNHMQQKQSEKKAEKERIIIPSRATENGEETEIMAHVTIATDGGWGWVVLICSFFGLAIIDGHVFTFGALLSNVSKDLVVTDAFGAFINSAEVSTYYLFSPLSSALINRYGFRTIAMAGSIICSCALFLTYFTKDFVTVLIFYGFVNGFGCSLVSLANTLIVGFYFEKLRNVALAIVSTGTSVGIMTMYPINCKLVARAGWRTTVLLHSALYGILYFLSLTFRPLLSLTVTTTEDQDGSMHTVTFIPSVSTTGIRPIMSKTISQGDASNASRTERLLGAVSNAYFPTAATIVKERALVPQAGPSLARTPRASASRIKLSSQSAVSYQQYKQIQSFVSTGDKIKENVEISVKVEEPKSTSCWERCCHWQSHTKEHRPLYRDDAFYQGKVDKLPDYLKTAKDVSDDKRSGLEQQMAVSRAVTVTDLQEHPGICTMAVCRVLATMLDPKLLHRHSFLFFSLCGFFTNAGVLVPYVYLQDRGLSQGVDSTHASLFVSVISLSNMIGRLLLSWLSMKVNALYIYAVGLFVAGLSTIFSSLSYTPVYQFGYSALFGFSMAASSALRSAVIVATYGLENLTNATGMVLMFTGFGNFFSTPLAAALKNKYGYEVSFYVAGTFILLASLTLVPMKIFVCREEKCFVKKDESEKNNTVQ